MRVIGKSLFIFALIVVITHTALAQTADEIIEKHLAAVGGRATLEKLKSRHAVGTVTITTPVGSLPGTIEVLNETPNKTRTYMKIDLSAVNLGSDVIDQRFDGNVGYAMDSLQGNRDITGQQLDAMKASSFPSPFLNYKAMGATIELTGKEKVGDRDAYVIVLKSPTGLAPKFYIDAQTYIPIKSIIKVNVAQLGRDLDQTSEFNDYRDVDGMKIPFEIKQVSDIQTLTVKLTKVDHNVEVDEKLFTKP